MGASKMDPAFGPLGAYAEYPPLRCLPRHDDQQKRELHVDLVRLRPLPVQSNWSVPLTAVD